jgi:sialidase-1
LPSCEGRKNGRGDSGDIDLVMKRSFDNGATWTPLQVIDDDGSNTTGNPTLVVHRQRRSPPRRRRSMEMQ